MALQDILDQILQQAQTEVTSIKHSTEQSKIEIEKEAAQALEAAKKKLHQKTLQKKEALEKKMKSLARSKRANLLLEAQREVVDQSLKKFIEYLLQLPEAQTEKVLNGLLSKIQDKEGEIFVAPSQMALITKNAPKGFRVQSDPAITGGFLIKTNHGESDHTFETLVYSEFKSELEIFLAKQLNFI